MEFWTVVDLEDMKAWVFDTQDEAAKKKEQLLKKYENEEDKPHIYISGRVV